MLQMIGDFNVRTSNNKSGGNTNTFKGLFCNSGRVQILLYLVLKQ